MRVFVAVDLALPTREDCGKLIVNLRRQPVFQESKVTWVHTANLHITLRFLREIEAGTADQMARALGAPWSEARFDVAFEGCDVFPPRGVPRAVYVAVKAESAARLAALYAEVTNRLGQCGIAPEPRRFRPHVTIGRVRRAAPRIANLIRAGARSTSADVQASPIDHVVLYQSRLSPAGPRYESLLRVPLGVEQGGGGDPSEATRALGAGE